MPEDTAVSFILAGRLLGGVGAANAAIGFAYIAKAVPHDKQTQTSSLLSMMRIIGMASGPGANVLLSKIDFKVGSFQVDSLNSVGLVLIGSNIFAMACIYFMLEEPKSVLDQQESSASEISLQSAAPDRLDVLKALITPNILVPMLSIFSLNLNFQIIETAFAPAASHALGWGPVQTSLVLGSNSVVIFINMMIVFQLSARKVNDETLVIFGLIVAMIGYTSIYIFWEMDASVWHFIVPIVMGTSCFPFLGAPSRSVFTKQVDSDHALDAYHGTMQALLSMAASVGGFVAPSFVAYYCLRQPEDVEASSNGRELTEWSLVGPLLSFCTLLGMIYILLGQKTEEKQATVDVENSVKDTAEEPSVPAGEQTGLLKTKLETQARRCSRRRLDARTESNRRLSACMMGISQPLLIGEDEQ
mmetsp:Transcript_24833/g.38272  ORF Transcript_24833/g.38272 Transcript_24833/m.38272 type:complete len:416 (+) Transcript_24833:323-1570(+)